MATNNGIVFTVIERRESSDSDYLSRRIAQEEERRRALVNKFIKIKK
jgi:hypothetical protein